MKIFGDQLENVEINNLQTFEKLYTKKILSSKTLTEKLLVYIPGLRLEQSLALYQQKIF